MPLTARHAQFPRPRLNVSKQRTYGKQRATAASRVLLREGFVDENEVEESLRALCLDTPGSAPTTATPTRQGEEEEVKKAKEARAAILRKVQKHQEEDAGAAVSTAFVGLIWGFPTRIDLSKKERVDEATASPVAPLLAEAGQLKSVVRFEAFGDSLAKAFRVVKLAEGSYGEVYKLLPRSAATSSTLERVGGCIIKVLALKSGSRRGQSNFSSVGAVACEVKLLKRMDEVVGFARFRGLNLVQGRFPPSFVEAFREYKDAGKDCQNPDPESFKDTQLFAIIEMDDAGTDLEQLKRPSIFQSYDIFWSTVLTLAVAEEQVQFEHRDLHIGNICIRPIASDGSFPDNSPQPSSTIMSNPDSVLCLSGVRTTIIDYTFSRAALDPERTDIAYDPMKDSSLFNSVGKGFEQALQFDTYRRMRKVVNTAERNALGENTKLKKTDVQKWSRFVPQTNIVWLNYLAQVLLTRANDQIVPSTNSSSEKLQKEMYQTFRAVADALDDDDPTVLPKSARHLMEMAQPQGWLTSVDIQALKEKLEQES